MMEILSLLYLNIDLNTDIITNAKEFVKAFYFVVEKFNPFPKPLFPPLPKPL